MEVYAPLKNTFSIESGGAQTILSNVQTEGCKSLVSVYLGLKDQGNIQDDPVKMRRGGGFTVRVVVILLKLLPFNLRGKHSTLLEKRGSLAVPINGLVV